MRVLWVCNLMPQTVAKALGEADSVREGWVDGALTQFLHFQADRRRFDGLSKPLDLGLCFPVRKERAGGGRGEICLDGHFVSWYGFWEDLRRPERDTPGLEAVFARILADFQPDLIHLFGTEFGHGLACAKVFAKPDRTLVGIQGVCSAIAAHYMDGLPGSVRRDVTLRDALRRDTLRMQQKNFLRRGEREGEILRMAGHVTGRTDFDRRYVRETAAGAAYHFCAESMRAGFYQGSWSLERCRRHRIFVCQADYPIKGFHFLLAALPEILAQAPDTEVAVAGNCVFGGEDVKSRLKRPAYGRYLRKLLKKTGAASRVHPLGSLPEEQIRQAYLESHVLVCPSVMENSPNSVAEAQLLGVPVVASDAGGIPSVVEDGKSGLLFPSGDAHALAERILRIFREDDLALSLSEGGRAQAERLYDGPRNWRTLLAVYGEMLS